MNRTSIGPIAISGLLALCFGSRAAAQSCMADLNGDRAVDGSDLANVLAQWGSCGSSESCSADVNNDGVVNGVDLGNVLAAWGFCPVTVPGWATLIEAYPDPAVVHDASLRVAIAATGYAWRVVDTATQIEMVLIPPGSFEMGCSPSNLHGCSSNESPLHSVTLTNAYYMGRYEVTQAQWTARMGSNPSLRQSASAQVPAEQVPNRPVEQVSWNTIQGFLIATGMRLPTEAEWEYAYRAGTTTAFHSMPGYPDGTHDDSQLGTIAWFNSNSASQTRPVGQKAGNGFGLHDMSGNVLEWVNDWHSSTYYESSPSVDPPGPVSGPSRVVRGGGWSTRSGYCRSSLRGYVAPSIAYYNVGFRVARAPAVEIAPSLSLVSPASGPLKGGTTITLTGMNLLGTTAVTVGGLAATSVQVVSSDTVTAVTPPGAAGARDVAVTTPGGTGIGTGAFTYASATVPPWATLAEPLPNPSVVHDEGLRASIVATGYAWRVVDTATQIEMVLIPPGTFEMGCSPSDGYGCESDEYPVHTVILTDAFYMGRYEVTQAQWTARMGFNPSFYQSASAQVPADQVPNRPVEQVSWDTVQGFLINTGMRLPTEAEWEYAYRAGTTTAFHAMPGYPSGTNDDSVLGNIAWWGANVGGNSGPNQTRPVGQLAGNGFGLHDMSGNVWEWVSDWYSPDYYASSPSVNPPGPSSGSHRVLRGGSWGSYTHLCRSSRRAYLDPLSRFASLGLRVRRNP